jgi:phosphatidate cytidylyltransferase
MSKIISRLLVFFVGIPVILLIIFAPFFNHLSLHLLICVTTFLGAGELYDIFAKKGELLPKKFVVFLSVFIPVVASVYAMVPREKFPFNVNSETITFAYIITILASLFYEVFTSREFGPSLHRLASSIFIVTYTGFLYTFVSRMTVWQLHGENITVPVVSVFILMVFMCDSIAWFLGVLFGKNNRGIVRASPNKSVMGFLGGFLGSVCAGILGAKIWPEIFHGSTAKIVFVGIFMAFSCIVGDLAESVFKRSADVKDSGNVIPGRGGMLDCLDSIVMSAPVYYLLVSILFGPF